MTRPRWSIRRSRTPLEALVTRKARLSVDAHRVPSSPRNFSLDDPCGRWAGAGLAPTLAGAHAASRHLTLKDPSMSSRLVRLLAPALLAVTSISLQVAPAQMASAAEIGTATQIEAGGYH